METTTPSHPSPTLQDRFPLNLALSRATQTRRCHDYSHWHYLQSGVGRIIESSRSGREWVKLFNALFANTISVGNFFKALNSKRRLSLLEEAAEEVRQQTHQHIRVTPLYLFDFFPIHPISIYFNKLHCFPIGPICPICPI